MGLGSNVKAIRQKAIIHTLPPPRPAKAKRGKNEPRQVSWSLEQISEARGVDQRDHQRLLSGEVPNQAHEGETLGQDEMMSSHLSQVKAQSQSCLLDCPGNVTCFAVFSRPTVQHKPLGKGNFQSKHVVRKIHLQPVRTRESAQAILGTSSSKITSFRKQLHYAKYTLTSPAQELQLLAQVWPAKCALAAPAQATPARKPKRALPAI